MSLLYKFKEGLSGLVDKLQSSNAALGAVIRENQQMLDAQKRVSDESREGIKALFDYGQKETPALKDALVCISETLEGIENNRLTLVADLEKMFISPLEMLVNEWKALQQLLKDKEKAEKAKIHAEESLAKKKAKPAAKLKPGEIEKADGALKSAESEFDALSSKLAETTESFQKKKVETLKDALYQLASLEKNYHQLALSMLTDTKMFVDMINVDVEFDAA